MPQTPTSMFRFNRLVLLIFLLLLPLGHNAFAQCLADQGFIDSGTTGLFPSPEMGPLPAGHVGSDYVMDFTIVVPTDTTIDLTPFGTPVIANVPVIYMTIHSVSGLPPGLSFTECDAPNCLWSAGSSGCFRIAGVPLEQGFYQPTMNANVTVNIPVIGLAELPSTGLVTYDLTINEPMSIGDQQYDGAMQIRVLQDGSVGVLRILAHGTAEKVYLIDLAGRVLQQQNVRSNDVRLNVSNVATGIYAVCIETDDGRVGTQRVLIRH